MASRRLAGRGPVITLDERLTVGVQEPLLRIGAAAWHDMVGWSRATDLEVSGLCRLAMDGDAFRIDEALLLRQSATPVETEIDPADVADLLVRLDSSGSDTSDIRVWWHSHAREAPFWSGVDERTISSFAPVAMISICLDHRLRRLARLDRFEPRQTCWVNLEVPELGPDAGGLVDARGADIARMVVPATASSGRAGSVRGAGAGVP